MPCPTWQQMEFCCNSKTNFSHSGTEPANHSNASRWNSVAKPIFLIVLHNLQITATPIQYCSPGAGAIKAVKEWIVPTLVRVR